MSRIDIARYICDLCGSNAEETGQYAIPTGWAKITIENKYLDRDFTDKHVCQDCVIAIKSFAKEK